MSAEPFSSNDRNHRDALVGADAGSWAGRTLPNGLKVLELVGATTDGQLYHAEYPDGREVALLLQGPGASGETPSPLRRHPLFQQATRIRHPNVAAVHEIGEIPGGPGYVVLESLTGEPLSLLLAQRGALHAGEAVELFLQAAAGVEAAHKVGLVHANLSPDSLLVTQTDDGPLVKLIRFAPVTLSLSDIRDAQVGDRGAAYPSPERLRGQIPDERGDVYGLAAILLHMLTGFPPEADSGALVSDNLGAVIARAMLPEPTQRYPSVPALVHAVRRAAARDEAAGRPRSRRPMLITVACIVVAISGGLWLGASAGEPAAALPDPVSQSMEPSPAPEPVTVPDDSIVASDTSGSAPDSSNMAPAQPRPLPAVQKTLPAAGQAVASPTQAPVEDSIEGYSAMEEDSVTVDLPPPPPVFLTPQERARVAQRIGLDEAREVLGGPPHAIEGMSPLLMGLAAVRFPDGADASRPLVRGVYLDPNGALILLDQQRITAGSEPPPPYGSTIHWAIGDIMLYLHGESGAGMLANLAKRVR